MEVIKERPKVLDLSDLADRAQAVIDAIPPAEFNEREAAELLGLSVDTLRFLCLSGQISHTTHMRGVPTFSPEDIAEYRAERREGHKRLMESYR